LVTFAWKVPGWVCKPFDIIGFSATIRTYDTKQEYTTSMGISRTGAWLNFLSTSYTARRIWQTRPRNI